MKIKLIAKKIKESKKIVLFHHIMADGDSISCSYGLLKSLKSKFPKKIIKWVAEIDFLKERFKFLNIDFKDVISGKEIDKTWTGIIGDNAILERIYGSEFFQKTGYKICFDHHKNKINFKANIFYQDSTLGASSIQAYYIAKELNVKYNSKNAILALFGILTDTGFFKYSLNDYRPLEIASQLLKKIENNELDELYKSMNKKTQKDLNIQKFTLNNYKLKNGVAYLKWKHKDQQKLNIKPEDCAKVNLISNIENSGAWIFFIEYKEKNFIRIEFRSSGLPVNEIAKKFGGGGHQRASGAKINIDWNLTNKIIEETQKQLKIYNKKNKLD